MKKFLLIVIMAACSAMFAEEFRIDFQFSPTTKLAGRIHGGLMILNDNGRRIVCRIRNSTVQERNWLAEYPKDSSQAMYMRTTVIDGVGKVLMLIREECLHNNEFCSRGVAYLIRTNGKWEQGVFSRRTLGWSERDVWGGYEFVLKEGKDADHRLP